MLKKFIHPIFIIFSFLIILGLFSPSQDQKQYWGIIMVLFVVSYVVTAVITTVKKAKTAQPDHPGNLPVQVRVRFIYPNDSNES
ncbi:hypothetical protein A8L34_28135 [Bacillus sp. FJAT-27264]|uniref:hypothetical protein n=1 Tax=Paenibacillus sp. (strain DSM 101736 / FJAT-27264) TaxID=1850362 RepID=UPI000807C20C|nr:hypothetical protein [Bacillus sp. FJAT-27264]OBZ15918.1 hypothetical protein A8L34_28135 [Bacillus sp. FJAT-27264]